MPVNEPACFRLDHWLWPLFPACGKPALLGGVPGSYDAEAALRADAGEGQPVPRRSGSACAARRPASVAMIEFDRAALRQWTPIRVRGPHPCRAHWPPWPP